VTIILDSNLLLLFVVGLASQDYIAVHCRLRSYSTEDFILLRRILSAATRVVVTPNILTETSNLAGYVAEPARTRIYRVLKALIEDAIEEQYVESKQAVAQGEFARIGLADSAILEIATASHTLLTVDLNLYLAALSRGLKAENFNHLRGL
jgi:hypothetical protein